MKIKGIDYSPEGIEWVRDRLAEMRDGDSWRSAVSEQVGRTDRSTEAHVALSVEELYALTDSMAFSARRLRGVYPDLDVDALHRKLTTAREGIDPVSPMEGEVNRRFVYTSAIALLAHLISIMENPNEVYTEYLHRKFPETGKADQLMRDLGLRG